MTTRVVEEDDVFLEEVDGWDNDSEDELFFDDDEDDDDHDGEKNTSTTESSNKSPTAVANTTSSSKVVSIAAETTTTISISNDITSNNNNNIPATGKETKSPCVVPTAADGTSSELRPEQVDENKNNNASSTASLQSNQTTPTPKKQIRIPASVASVPLATISSSHGMATPSTSRTSLAVPVSAPAAITTTTTTAAVTGGVLTPSASVSTYPPSISSTPNTPLFSNATPGTINNNTTSSKTTATPSTFALGSAVGLGSFWSRLAATTAPVQNSPSLSVSSPTLKLSESQPPKPNENGVSAQVDSCIENTEPIQKTQYDKLYHSPRQPTQVNQNQTENRPTDDEIPPNNIEDVDNAWDNDFSLNTDGVRLSKGDLLAGSLSEQHGRIDDNKDGVNQIASTDKVTPNDASSDDNAWGNDFSFNEDVTEFPTDDVPVEESQLQKSTGSVQTQNVAKVENGKALHNTGDVNDSFWRNEFSFNDDVITNVAATNAPIGNNSSVAHNTPQRSTDQHHPGVASKEHSTNLNNLTFLANIHQNNAADDANEWDNEFSFNDEPDDIRSNDQPFDSKQVVQLVQPDRQVSMSTEKSKSSVSGVNEWDSSYFLDDANTDVSTVEEKEKTEEIVFFAGTGDTPSSIPTTGRRDNPPPNSFSGMIQQSSSSQSLVFNDANEEPRQHHHQQQPCTEQEIVVPPMDHIKDYILVHGQTQDHSDNQILVLQRQLHEAQMEIISLRAMDKSTTTSESSNTAAFIDSTVLTTLQEHHKQHLQIEYDVIDRKIQQIKELKSSQELLQDEKRRLAVEITQYQQKTVPLLQNEILALSSERDILQRNIDEVNQGLASFKNIFGDVQRKHADEVSVLSGQIATLQFQLTQKEERILAMDAQFRQEGQNARSMFDNERNHLLEQIRQSNYALQTYENETQAQLQFSNDRIQQQLQEIQSLHQVLTNTEHRMRQLLSRNSNNNEDIQRSEQSSGEATEGATVSKRSTTLIELFHRLDRDLTQKDDEIQRLEDVIENMTFHQDDIGEDPVELRAELDAMSEEKHIMTEQIRNLDEKCKGLRSTIDSLTTAKSTSDETIEQQSQEIAQLRLNLENATRDFQDQKLMWEKAKTAELLTISRETQSLQASLNIKTKENLDLLHQVESIAHEKAELVRELKGAVESRKTAEQAIQQLKDDTVEPLRRELQQVSADYEKVETERQQSVKYLAEMNKEFKRIEQQLTMYRNENEQLENRVAAITTERDAALENCRNITTRLSELQVSYDHILHTADIERNNHQTSINELEAKFQTLSKEYDKLLLLKSSFDGQAGNEKLIIDLRQQLEDTTVMHERVIAELYSERDKDVRKAEETSTKAIHRLQEEIDQLKKENEELYVQFALLNNKYEEAKAKLVDYIQEKDNLQAQLHEVTSHSTELTSLAETLIEERDNLSSQVQQLQLASAEITSTLKTAALPNNSTSNDEELLNLKEKFQQKQLDILSLQQQLKESTQQKATNSTDQQQGERISELESANKRLEEEIVALKLASKPVDPAMKPKLIHELESRIVSLVNEVDTLRNDLTSTNESLASKDDVIQKLTMDLLEAQTQHKKLLDDQEAKKRAAAIAIGSEKDVESLRGYIVTLAQALEQSERKRAEAVEKLADERLAHAEALKKLGQSVKQYYSRMTLMGDPSFAMNGNGAGSPNHRPNGTLH